MKIQVIAVVVLLGCMTLGDARFDWDKYSSFHQLLAKKYEHIHSWKRMKFHEMPTPSPEEETPVPEPSPVPSPAPKAPCTDVPPTAEYTCAEEKAFGNCGSRRFRRNNYCEKTCGACPEGTTSEPECSTIAETAAAVEDLSTLVTLLQAADLVDTLNDPEFVGTVFAPTNDAFAKLLEEAGITLDDLLSNVDALTEVLLFHVVGGAAATSDVIENGDEFTTLLGDQETLVATKDSESVQIVPEGGSDAATVVIPDVIACKAVVHVIDAVLIPAEFQV